MLILGFVLDWQSEGVVSNAFSMQIDILFDSIGG